VVRRFTSYFHLSIFQFGNSPDNGFIYLLHFHKDKIENQKRTRNTWSSK